MKVCITTCTCPGRHTKSLLLHADTPQDDSILDGLKKSILGAFEAEGVKVEIETLTTAELIAGDERESSAAKTEYIN